VTLPMITIVIPKTIMMIRCPDNNCCLCGIALKNKAFIY
jgi:hypothetical protein